MSSQTIDTHYQYYFVTAFSFGTKAQPPFVVFRFGWCLDPFLGSFVIQCTLVNVCSAGRVDEP
jgi:hypothetical protein